MLTKDLDILFNGPDSVTVTIGAISFKGLLDQPDVLIAEGMIASTEYMLTIKTSDYIAGTQTLKVNNETYRVRVALKTGDGLLTDVKIGKL